MRRTKPKDGQVAWIRVKSWTKTYIGRRENKVRTMLATYCRSPKAGEHTSFVDNFEIDDDNAQWSDAEVIAWSPIIVKWRGLAGKL